MTLPRLWLWLWLPLLLISQSVHAAESSLRKSSRQQQEKSNPQQAQRRTDVIDVLLDDPDLPNHDTARQSPRIINGQDMTDPTRYPWFVQLRTNPDANGQQTACGGSLIAPDVVLTAAHCICAPLDEDGNRACG